MVVGAAGNFKMREIRRIIYTTYLIENFNGKSGNTHKISILFQSMKPL